MTEDYQRLPDPPLHNLLICNGPECVPGCPKYQWAIENGIEPSPYG